MIRQLVPFFLFVFILIGCNQNNKVTIELFSPNPLLTPNDVYNLNLPRVSGIDIDMFQIFNKDTIVCLETGDDMVFGQSWLIPVDSIVSLDDLECFFEKQYDVITLSKDTIININQEEEITFKAYSKRNKLYFQYKFTDLQYHIEGGEGKAVIIYYYFPKYEKHLNSLVSGSVP